jgi:L-2,4-diaminobutyrate decarboxylase
MRQTNTHTQPTYDPGATLAEPRPSQSAPLFSDALLAQTLAGSRELARMVTSALGHYQVPHNGNPLPPGKAEDVVSRAAAVLGVAEIPQLGIGESAAIRRVTTLLVEHGIRLASSRAAAHLQPPPLTVAVAADMMASFSNASVDTYDSGPSGIALERWVIKVLTQLAGLPSHADGVMTPGGSLSNLQALLLARNSATFRAGHDPQKDGVNKLSGPRIFCSEVAHFSIQRAAGALGLGESSVVPIPVDEHRRMSVPSLARALASLRRSESPVAIVATAGTTDFGSIDPLNELADLAAQHDVWLHIDAAYGFGALFSRRLAPKLAGIQRAQSITLDMHKLGWQPAAASVLLVSHSRLFRSLEREVAYLNPIDDVEAGLDGLLGRSLQTTRRPDAAKVAATLLAFGRSGLGAMVDACHNLACYAQQLIQESPRTRLMAPAELTTVVFRYVPEGQMTLTQEDELNGLLRRLLLESGQALIGRTTAHCVSDLIHARTCLKFTLLNPTMTNADIDELLRLVVQTGRRAEAVVRENAV